MARVDRNPPPQWRQYAVVLGVIGGLVVGVFWLLGLLVDNLVWLIPPSLEQQLGRLVVPAYEQRATPSRAQDQLNGLLDDLEALLPDRQGRNYRLLFIPDGTVNALAIPGDVIVVYGGLLNKMQSENELVMVLGHELGHFANRDHLRGITRSLALQVILSLIFGDAGDLGRVAGGTIEAVVSAGYSQGQELQADEFGLTILHQKYNHAGGAVDFFERIGQAGATPIPFLSSHPNPNDRVARLNQLIQSRGYALGTKIPLAIDFKPSPDPSPR